MIDTLKFMGQLGIPFRGHRDNGRLEPVSDIKEIDTSTENFRAILQLHSMGNSELAAYLKESPSNPTYLRPDIQNESITLIGKEILSSISSEVQDAFYFAVIADETFDKSIKSQLSIVVRYLNGDTLTERRIDIINQPNLKSFNRSNLVSVEVFKLALGKNDRSRLLMERVLCRKEKGIQAIVRVLRTSCICSLFDRCIEFSFDKILCDTENS